MYRQQGQTLITLLFFMVIAISITTAGVIMIMTNSLSSTRLEQGTEDYYIAESGVENALIRLLRDPTYTGETLTVGSGSAAVTVTNNSGTYTITSLGSMGNFTRKIQAVVSYTNNILNVTSWSEIF